MFRAIPIVGYFVFVFVSVTAAAPLSDPIKEAILPEGAIAQIGSSQFQPRNELTRIRWSDDGNYLIAITRNRSILFWELRSGKLVHSLTGFDTEIRDVALAGSGRLAVLEQDELIVYSQWKSTEPRRIDLKNPITVQFNARGDSIFLFTSDGLYVREFKDLSLQWHEPKATAYVYAHQRNQLFYGTTSGEVAQYDPDDGKSIKGKQTVLNEAIQHLDLSFDGRLLASTGAKQSAISEVENGKIIHSSAAKPGLQFIPNQSKLLSHPQSTLVEIDLKGKETEFPITNLNQIALSNDGQWLAGIDRQGQLRLFTTPDYRNALSSTGHRGPIRQVIRLRGEKERWLSLATDGLGIWDGSQSRFELLNPEFASVRSLWLAPDQKQLWYLEKQKLVGIKTLQWDRLDASVKRDACTIDLQVAPLDGIHFLARKNQLLIGSQRELLFVDRDRQEIVQRVKIDFNIASIALSSNQRNMAIYGSDGLLRMMRLHETGNGFTLAEQWKKRVGLNKQVPIQFSPDGLMIAGSAKGQLILSDTLSGRVAQAFDREFGEGDISTFSFVPGNSGVVVAYMGDRAKIRLWSFASRVSSYSSIGPKQSIQIEGHGGAITGIAFRPDASELVSVGQDQSIIRWKSNLGQPASLLSKPPIAIEQLDQENFHQARLALESLWSDRKAAVPLVRERLSNESKRQQDIQKWLKNLDSDEFRTRETARKSLLAAEYRGVQAIQDALKTSSSAEVTERLKRLLETLAAKGFVYPEGTLFGDALFRLRVLYFVEQLDPELAKPLLQILSEREKEDAAAREAKQLLKEWKD